MFPFSPTVILRHRRENLKKCSLHGLENRPDCLFFTYPKDSLPNLDDYILLTLDAPPLTAEDASHGLFLIDGTWRHSAKMLAQLDKPDRFLLRSIPTHFQTAYPRRQEDSRGLASIEALYAAYHILQRPTTALLDNYHWKEAFLLKNNLREEKGSKK